MKTLVLLFTLGTFALAEQLTLPQNFTADFTQTITNPKKKVIHYKGNVRFSNEKLLKWSYINPTKKEGCYLLRPTSSKDICLGEQKVALIGEAAGFISPTSAEGISYAMLSADALGDALLENKVDFLKLYAKRAKSLKKNITTKLLKYPMMYNAPIRRAVFATGIGAIKVQ